MTIQACLIVALLFNLAPASVQEPFMLNLEKGWRFHTDPADQGLAQRWFAPDFDDSQWTETKAAVHWEDIAPGYDGVGWYRIWAKLPPDVLTEHLWLGFGGVDDEYDLFINGQLAGHYGSREKGSVWDEVTATDIGRFLIRGQRNLICLRVVDWGGEGGLVRLPAMLVSDETLLLGPQELMRKYVGEHPEWIWPRWAMGKGGAWTATGLVAGVPEAIMSWDGAMQPWNRSFSVNVWVYDRATQHLYTPETSTGWLWSLEDGHLPIPHYRWRAGALSVEQSLCAAQGPKDFKSGVSLIRVVVKNLGDEPADTSLLITVRPYTANFGVTPINQAAYDRKGGFLSLNGSLALVPERAPDRTGFALSGEGDISRFALEGRLPERESADDPRGLASGALEYPLRLAPGESVTIYLKSPPEPIAPTSENLQSLKALSAQAAWEHTADDWKALLSTVQIELPDKRYQDAYSASLAYILLTMDDDMLHPGPLAYDSFWYRDGAYMIRALEGAGMYGEAANCLRFFVHMQRDNGEFPSIVSGRREAVGPPEWDSQGQAIYSLVEHYRFTRDKAWLRQVFPSIRKGAEFLREIRKQRLTKEFENTETFGILPPSVSAEDIGSGSWHHYWDDFWAVRGLRDAAFAARELGEPGLGWLAEEADLLEKATSRSTAAVMKRGGIDWIPNGPEDLNSSSMARGTSAGLWPSQVLHPDDPLVRRSFQVYYEKWVQPSGGGFLHHGNFWPYAGLELAHCYLFLGERDKCLEIVNWDLRHQTAKGVYGWAEVVNPETLLFGGGDLPHCWASAELVCLVRDMLVREEEDALVLLSGVPAEWLAPGKKITIKGAPTYFGPLDLEVQGRTAAGVVTLNLGGQAKPPNGFKILLPDSLTPIQVAVPGATIAGQAIHLPAGTRGEVRVQVRAP